MANRKNTFLLKRSNVPDKIPQLSGLTIGELALNTADAKLYAIYTSGNTSPQGIRQIGWDRISRTGDTVTGDFTFNGDVTITSGFTFTNNPSGGYVLTSDSLGNASWEMLPTPTNLTFFSTTASSDVVGYSKLVISLDDPDYNTTPVDVSTGAITGTSQLIASLVADTGIFAGNPGAINISTIGEIRRTGGSGVAEFYYEVYQRNNLGVETLICTSNKTSPVTTSVYQQFQASALFNNGTWLETDRVVIKYYGDRIPGASNPTYDFLFGGSNPVRTLFPISAQLLLNVPITIGITGVVSGTTDYVLTVDSNGKLAQIDPNLATFTIDLIDNSTVDFYAPYDLRINTVTLINGTGIETIEVNNASYTLTNLINQGDKITVSVTTPSVLNLNIRYE